MRPGVAVLISEISGETEEPARMGIGMALARAARTTMVRMENLDECIFVGSR